MKLYNIKLELDNIEAKSKTEALDLIMSFIQRVIEIEDTSVFTIKEVKK
jgi:hypothetical protein